MYFIGHDKISDIDNTILNRHSMAQRTWANGGGRCFYILETALVLG